MVLNIDTDLYPSKLESIEAALADPEPGTLVVCRGDWGSCPTSGESCDACARIPVVPGLTAADVLSIARPSA